jgi:FkbM family methyltransferase
MISLQDKFGAYISSCLSLRGGNWRGFPGFPKKWSEALPYNRHNFNTFIAWIGKLGLSSAAKIVDVGANHGDFAAAASVCFPKAEILLFEPLPTLHEELKRRARHYPGWAMDFRAVGASRARLPLQVPEGQDDIASLAGFSREYEAATGQRIARAVFECEVVPLDDALEKETGRIDLIKIDVEGFEFEVLRGAEKTLARTEALIVELSLIRQQERGTELLAAMIRLMEAAGFRVVDVIPSLWHPVHSWMPLEYNLLARRPSFA